MGDIEPISAQEFMRQMKEILKEERENQTNEEWFCGLDTVDKAVFLLTWWRNYNGCCEKGCCDIHADECNAVRFLVDWLKSKHTDDIWVEASKEMRVWLKQQHTTIKE